ncbi:hypothetical protein ABKN59_002501 [Abortiporus biennis]
MAQEPGEPGVIWGKVEFQPSQIFSNLPPAATLGKAYYNLRVYDLHIMICIRYEPWESMMSAQDTRKPASRKYVKLLKFSIQPEKLLVQAELLDMTMLLSVDQPGHSLCSSSLHDVLIFTFIDSGKPATPWTS